MTRSLCLIVTIAMLGAVAAVFLYAPTEKQMGDVQRIFYFHVASALSAGVAYFLVFLGSVQYLRTRQDRWDRFAAVSAELGVLYSAFVLFSGPLWARPIWGVFWRWEPRLTTMLITFTIYVAYLMVRSYGEPGERTQRFAAVVGIVAFVNVPLVHYSVNMWAVEQQLHPQQVELDDPAMLHTKYLCYFTFVCLFVLLMRLRLSQERLAARLQALLRLAPR
jgi:heme exporter protein C